MAHRDVLDIKYHEWWLLLNFALLWSLLGILRLPRMILILVVEPQISRVEGLLLVVRVLLVGRLLTVFPLLAITALLGVVSAFVPVFGVVALALSSSLVVAS